MMMCIIFFVWAFLIGLFILTKILNPPDPFPDPFLLPPAHCLRVDTMSTEMDDSSAPRRRVSCTKYFDALWFCYWMSRCSNKTSNGDETIQAPYYQMQQYYRVGKLDDCTKKFSALFDCLSLKTKSSSEAEKILEEQEKADAANHIWIMRTQEEASSHWNETFGHLDDPNY